MKIILLFLFFLPAISFADSPYFCDRDLDEIPIQQGGRVKPLYVHAKETLKFLTGKAITKTKENNKNVSISATQAFCLLSLKSMGLPIRFDIMAPIEHEKLKQYLKLEENHPKVSFQTLTLKKSELISEYRMQKDESSYKKALNKVLSRINVYTEITTGINWVLAKPNGEDFTWSPIIDFFNPTAVMSHKGSARSDYLYNSIVETKNLYSQKDDTFLLELKYSRANFVGWALLLTLLALACKTLFKNEKITIGLASLTLLIQTVYLVLRTMISGRAPVTNMYETVLFSGYGALVVALIVGHYKKEILFVVIALAYNVLTLMMLIFADGMLSERISPLVPVLRDNFWLSTHVTSIIISYGALALSWVLANGIIIRKKFFSLSKQDENYLSELIYTCLKIGTVLLAGGIILGGVWADYSWGRFWGWDPKETWSLIVLCIYIAILHGRYTSWIPNRRFIPLVAAAFMSVMMAWFGVNYILATGLHSYGFSQGGAVFLFSFFAVQIGIIIFNFIPRRS